MGSGISSSYSGTEGSSQPYAETYHVVGKMMDDDKKDPNVYDKTTGYFKNPTATTLEDATVGNRIKIAGKDANGPMTYVMDKDGNIIVGKRVNPNDGSNHAPHPTLIGGKDPEVQCAGMLTFEGGKISKVDNQSGHFRPNAQSMDKVNAALQDLCNKNPNLFTKNSVWRKNNGK